jgi:mannose-6-phosphate isomerase-like protein (cupin superfamily)
MEADMENGTTRIIDLNAETAKLTMFHGRTPTTTFAERRGTATQLGPYRDGILLLSKSAGTGHWETHPEDELLYVLDGAMTVDILAEDRVQSIAVSAGMIAVVPPGAWHRVYSPGGVTVMSATIPGDHIDLDVANPRLVGPDPASGARVATDMTNEVVDLNAELAKLTMFRRTPAATEEDRKGSVARLASYRDGAVFALRSSGTDHWESHLTGDELVFVLDGTATLEVVGEVGPQRFALRAGMLAVIPQGAWHRVKSPDGVAQLSVTPFPGEHVELDVDDPRTVAGKSA